MILARDCLKGGALKMRPISLRMERGREGDYHWHTIFTHAPPRSRLCVVSASRAGGPSCSCLASTRPPARSVLPCLLSMNIFLNYTGKNTLCRCSRIFFDLPPYNDCSLDVRLFGTIFWELKGCLIFEHDSSICRQERAKFLCNSRGLVDWWNSPL